MVDITERKKMEKALQKANDELEQQAEERTVELRTALSEIKILQDQLEAENIYFRQEDKAKHQFEHIIGQSDGLKYTAHAYMGGKVQPGRIRRNVHRLHGSLLRSLFSAPVTGLVFTLLICSGIWYSRENIASVPERIFEWKLKQ